MTDSNFKDDLTELINRYPTLNSNQMTAILSDILAIKEETQTLKPFQPRINYIEQENDIGNGNVMNQSFNVKHETQDYMHVKDESTL